MSKHCSFAIESLEARQFLSATKLGSITGSVFADLNLNGGHEAGEAGVRSAYVFLDLNNNGLYDKKTEPFSKTDKRGAFAFTGLAAGTYRLRELLSQTATANSLATMEVSAPTSGWFRINLSAGQNVVRRFGNVGVVNVNVPPQSNAITNSGVMSSVAGTISLTDNDALLHGSISGIIRLSTAARNASAPAVDVSKLVDTSARNTGLWTFNNKSGLVFVNTLASATQQSTSQGSASLNGSVTGADYSQIDFSFGQELTGYGPQFGWINGIIW